MKIATTHDEEVFSFHHDQSPCHGFEEVLNCYRRIVPNLRLSGRLISSIYICMFRFCSCLHKMRFLPIVYIYICMYMFNRPIWGLLDTIFLCFQCVLAPKIFKFFNKKILCYLHSQFYLFSTQYLIA